eukprot:jgi/Tetstr1/454597/TSEL_041490.t1
MALAQGYEMVPPVATPAFQAPGQQPPLDRNPLIDAATAELLGNLNGITVRQKLSWVEGLSQGMCEVRNRFTFHPGAGNEALNAPAVMSGMERSNGCTRCCCAPYHNLFVEFKHGADPDAQVPAVFTMERQGVCGKLPCCWVCSDTCRDGMVLHAGAIPQEPGDAGKLADYSRVIGSAKEWGGLCNCTPTLEVFDGTLPEAPGAKASSMIQGPCFFGGCSELCVESEFRVSKPHSAKRIGDVAIIKKLRPRTFSDFCQELCTDSDRYYIQFIDPTLTPQQKATLMGSLMLSDYMFFEQDNGMVDCSHNQVTITCCMYYWGGCLCPCKCVLRGNDG